MKKWKYFNAFDLKKEAIGIVEARGKKEAYIAASKIKDLDLIPFKDIFKIEQV
jgi:hypothetical protein